MEALLAIVAILSGGVYFLYDRLQKEKTKNKIIETKAKDEMLEASQEEIQKLIQNIDAGIEKLKKDKETNNKNRKHMSLKERADAARKRYRND